MSSPLYTRPCCNIKTCSLWQANVTVSVSRSVAMLRCQPLCSLQATAAWAPSVASTNLQQFRSGPRPTHRINAHNLNWVSVRTTARGRERNVGSACGTWHGQGATFPLTMRHYPRPHRAHGGRQKRNPEALRRRMNAIAALVTLRCPLNKWSSMAWWNWLAHWILVVTTRMYASTAEFFLLMNLI